jgi:periplasmic protein TonB
VKKKGEWIFRGTVLLSIAAHGVLLTHQAGDEVSTVEQLIRIPVVLEAEPPPPPPPPPERKKEPPNPKVRPKNLAKRIRKVVEGDGLRTGEIVDAEVGEYDTDIEEPPPPPPLPPPPELKPKPRPKPEPEVDKVALAREYLGQIRTALMANKEYPTVAQRMGLAGSATVSFTIEANASFSNILVRHSSGHDVLDKAAISTVQKQSGKHKRPAELADVPLKTSVALKFEIQK